MSKVLISPLGLSPGVVTGAYYALRDAGYGDMNKIITIGTSGNLVRMCEREIASELDRIQDELHAFVEYEAYSIESDEIRSSTDVTMFTDTLIRQVQQYSDGNHGLYMNLTGGRKSMTAAAAMVAQLSRVEITLFHLSVDELIEREGHISSLLSKPTAKRRIYLHPPADRIAVVEIPLLLVGQPRYDLLAALFENRVGEFVTRRWNYPRVRYNFYPSFLREQDVGEVDVYADDTIGQSRRVLAIECKLRVGDDPDMKQVTLQEVEQLHRKAELLKGYRVNVAANEGYAIRFEAWLVTNATGAEEAARVAAKKSRIALKRAELPRNWRDRADWAVINIYPMDSE